MAGRRFTAEVTAKGAKVFVAVPFDPDTTWGAKARHHVTGSVDGNNVRCVLERDGAGWRLPLGPAWRRDCGVAVGDRVVVVLDAEGPQRDDLAPDVAAALGASPAAAAFFDSLAQFYRKGYLAWIDATKRRPELRAERIATMIERLEGGHKQRP